MIEDNWLSLEKEKVDRLAEKFSQLPYYYAGSTSKEYSLSLLSSSHGPSAELTFGIQIGRYNMAKRPKSSIELNSATND